MAITRVNKLGTANNTGSAVSSLTLTVGATTTTHNRIIVAATFAAQNPTMTCTDSQGNNYTLDKNQGDGVGGASVVYSARADNPLTSGVDTITLTFISIAVNTPAMAAYEYSGLANFSPLDKVVATKSTSNSPASGPATTSYANELIFGLITWIATANISSPAYTQLDAISLTTKSLETQEDIVAATGSYNVTAHLDASQQWTAILLSYADTPNSSSGPANTTAPVITGQGMVGMQLTCSRGFWTNIPTAYAYQWKRDGVNVSTGAHYLVTTADVGHVLSCAVTASNKYAGVTATASNTVTPSVNSVKTGLGI